MSEADKEFYSIDEVLNSPINHSCPCCDWGLWNAATLCRLVNSKIYGFLCGGCAKEQSENGIVIIVKKVESKESLDRAFHEMNKKVNEFLDDQFRKQHQNSASDTPK